jgi:hypothetical protein
VNFLRGTGMTAIQARQKWCREIVQALEQEFGLWRRFTPCEWDAKRAAEFIDLRLPMSQAEAIEEAAKMI